MAALSMVTIAALVAGRLDWSGGMSGPFNRSTSARPSNAGLSIVLLAIVLDRVTTAASRRAEPGSAHKRSASRRNPLHFPGGFPGSGPGDGAVVQDHALGSSLPAGPQRRTGDCPGSERRQPLAAIQPVPLTVSLSGRRHQRDPEPVQSAPDRYAFYILVIVIALVAYALGGWKLAVLTTACLGGIIYLGLWSDSMVTLAAEPSSPRPW